MSRTKKIVIMSGLVLLLAVTAVFNFVLAGTVSGSAEGNEVTTANYFETGVDETSGIILKKTKMFCRKAACAGKSRIKFSLKARILPIFSSRLQMLWFLREIFEYGRKCLPFFR